MIKSLIIFVIPVLVSSCETKQWNLNRTMGNEPINPNDYRVLFIKWNQTKMDSTQLRDKRNFDEAILKELKLKHLGGQAANDDPSETDVHFVVAKEYKEALSAIVGVSKTVVQNMTVYLRTYNSDKWADKVIYP